MYHAYCEDKKLDMEGQNNWVTLVRSILIRCNLERDWQNQQVHNKSKLLTQVRIQLEDQFKTSFFNQVSSVNNKSGKQGNKLRTYNIIKTKYETEKYLLLDLPPHIKRAITQIRISAHSLEIETGRMARPKIPPDERFCKHCKVSVENEIHFVTECPLYNQLRLEMIRECPPEFQNLTGENMFKTFFTCQNATVIHQLGIYICRAMAKRNCLLYTCK